MSRRDTIWKWVFYTAGVFLLLLLQGLALDHISRRPGPPPPPPGDGGGLSYVRGSLRRHGRGAGHGSAV